MKPLRLFLLFFALVELLATPPLAYDGDFPTLFWDFSADNALLWIGSGDSSNYAAGAWTAAGDGMPANYSADSTSSMRSYATWSCDAWASGYCTHWTPSGESQVTTFYLTRTCTSWNGTRCAAWSGSGGSSVYTECQWWNCTQWNSSAGACAAWDCLKPTQNANDYNRYNCTSFKDGACTYWVGLTPRQTIGMHTFWQCQGCTPRFLQRFQVTQGDAAVGSEVNWSVSVTGVGNGTCNYTSLPSDRLSLSLNLNLSLNSSIIEQSYSNSSSWVSWNCNFSTGSYEIKFSTSPPSASESAWALDAGKTSNLSTQFLKKDLQITNPSSLNYSNVAWNTTCFQNFACPSANGLVNVSGGLNMSVAVNASGDALLENWSSFSQDSSKTTAAGGRAYITMGLNVSNAASLNFSNVSINWAGRPSWNCSALDTLDFQAEENYSNASFVFCWKDNAITKSESGWALDAGYDNTLESQRLVNVLNGSNDEDVSFVNVSAAAGVQSPEGNLTAKNEATSLEGIVVPAGSLWSWNATSTSDWINDSLVVTQNGSWIWYYLNAENTTNVSFTNVRGWIDLDDSFAKIYQQLWVNASNEWINVTPSSACPDWQAFIVEENETKATWKSCSLDTNGNGVTDRFEFIVPRFSFIALRAGGRGLKSNGEVCSSSSECLSGYCAGGICAQPPSTGGGGSSGGGSSGGGGVVTSNASSSPTQTRSESKPPATPESKPSSSALNETSGNETEVRLPHGDLAIGYHTISITSNGAPAKGIVKITDPQEKTYYHELGPDGTLTFFFDKDGEWRIEFNNIVKNLRVVRSILQAPSKKVLGPPVEGTGMFMKGVSVPALTVSTLFFVASLAALYFLLAALYLQRTRLKVVKRFEGGVVEIEVHSGRQDLKDAVLLDITPRGSAASHFSEKPSLRETIFGMALKWRRRRLGKGEVWRVKYWLRVPANANKLKQAEVHGTDAHGKMVVASTGEIPLD